MPWEIERDEAFDKTIRGLCKKYPSAEDDILAEFRRGPAALHSDALPKFARKLWKARTPSTDLRKGKSKGFRVIYYWDESLPNWCCLGTCYFKGDRENLPAAELDRLHVTFKVRLERFLKLVADAEMKADQRKQEAVDPNS